MSIPTVGEQRFQAQLLHALNEIADAIREHTGAVRELTGVLQSTAKAQEPPSPPPGEFQIPPGP